MTMHGWTTSPARLAQATGDWITQARWFTGDPDAELRFVHASPIAVTDHVTTVLFLVRSGELPLSVPLTFRRAGGAASSPGPIGAIDDVRIWDATDDPDGQRALLDLLMSGRTDTSGALRLEARPLRRDLPAIASSHRLTSEQSNTSVIYSFAEPDSTGSQGLILKLFRVLSNGVNPDVELQQALDAVGSAAVPRQYGSVRGAWQGMEADVLVAQEFLAGALDAWQVVTGRLSNADFAVGDDITQLGALTAQIHRELAGSFDTQRPNETQRNELISQWHARAEQAIADAPQLAEHRDAIRAVFAKARDVEWPALQRIHGDYHLGQVLRVPDRGWVALDFEGEPLRPLAQRTAPDLALRDVAGMLRSFDYAGGSALLAGGDEQLLADWASRAQHAFLTGYGELSADEQVLLDALVLDKALYEVSYEVAARPDWVEIPILGVLRLISRSKT
ncbi:phosphotransferase [Trueperella bialowiezensis]|uniref:Maltokinase n=1 Tax=Trueperella bialowiezensis TaxID=312285 RepID=A0A448PFR1_9ACTO|nr:phosphotransferase [Trueperella bialowiezensis]VEI13785.1 Maltokinase [Trueperella bialowiezensis]